MKNDYSFEKMKNFNKIMPACILNTCRFLDQAVSFPNRNTFYKRLKLGMERRELFIERKVQIVWKILFFF